MLALAVALAAQPALARVSPERVSEAVRAHVAEREGVAVADVQIAHLGLGRDLRCPSEAAVEVDSRASERFVGRADVRIVARAGGGVCDRLDLRPRIEIWTTAPVAARPAPAGGTVELAQGRVRRGAVQGVPVDPDAGPYVARAPLAPGEPVTLVNARRAPDDRSGQPVKLLARRGGVQLEAAGRLMSDARIGDTVQVVNTATGVVVRGTLVEPGVVRAGVTP